MNKTTIVNEYELPIEVNRESSYYVAKCPIWSDCYAQGHSLEDVVSSITDVAKSLIEIYEQDNKSIPLKLKSQSKSDTKFRFDLSIFAPAF